MTGPLPRKDREEGPSSPGDRSRGRVAVLLLLAGLAGLVAGALLLTGCELSPAPAGCGGANLTCSPQGTCPQGTLAVLLVLAGSVVLAVGIARLLGRRPEGEEPHPEPPPPRPPPDTALTRMEQEAEARRRHRERERTGKG